jgi:multiple sugar transport system substrate-binding protein
MWDDRIRRRDLLVGAGGAAVGALAMVGASALGRDRSEEPGELVVLSGADQSEDATRRRLIRDWNDTYSASPARMIELGGVADDHRSEMVARGQADEPRVDVFNLDVIWIAEFAAFGYIQPLPDPTDTEGFLGPPLATCRYGGDLWALPFNTDAGLLFVNWDLVGPHRLTDEQYNSAEDWQGLMELVKRVLPGAPVGTYGYAGQHRNYEGLTVNALEWPEQADPMVTGDWRDAMVDSQVVLVDEVCDPQVDFLSPDATSFTESETTRAFRQGSLVFMRNWPVAYTHLGQGAAGDDPPSEGVREIGVWRLPGASVLGGQNLAISSRSPRPRMAQTLIEFLTNDKNQKTLFRDGGLPATRTSAYGGETEELRPYACALRDAICESGGGQCARLRPSSPYYGLFSETFHDALFRETFRDGRAGEPGCCRLPNHLDDQLEDALRGYRPE